MNLFRNIIKKISDVLDILVKPIGLLHESLHYLPAWWWGLNPYIYPCWCKMRHDRTSDARALIILLIPAFFGLLLFPFVWMLIVHKVMFYISVTILWIGWMGACGKDLYTAGYFLIFKKWHNRKDEV